MLNLCYSRVCLYNVWLVVLLWIWIKKFLEKYWSVYCKCNLYLNWCVSHLCGSFLLFKIHPTGCLQYLVWNHAVSSTEVLQITYFCIKPSIHDCVEYQASFSLYEWMSYKKISWEFWCHLETLLAARDRSCKATCEKLRWWENSQPTCTSCRLYT